MKNRLGIKVDPEMLRAVERELTSNRLEDDDEITRTFDERHLRDIHKHLFQDIYEWAGTMRSDTIEMEGETFNVLEHANLLSKGKSTFLPASHLDRGLAHVENLASSKETRSPNKETFAEAATAVLSDLNYAHPFREGNGRTQRAFVEQLAVRTDHELDFEGVTAARNNAASIDAHDGNTKALHRIISESLDPEIVELRLDAIEHLNNLGQNPQNVRVGVAQSGQHIDGKFIGQNEGSSLFSNGELTLTAIPSTRCPTDLKQGQQADFTYDDTTKALPVSQADLLD